MATPNYNDPRAGTNAFSIGQQELLRLKNRIGFIEEAFEKLDNDPADAIPTKLSELQNDVGFITADDIPDIPEGTIPTKTSDLTNDSGFITEDDLPTVPTKTSDLTNDSGFITEDDLPTVPTKTSDLTNDSGFITEDDLPTVPTKTSDLTNDSGFITAADSTITGVYGNTDFILEQLHANILNQAVTPTTQKNVTMVMNSDGIGAVYSGTGAWNQYIVRFPTEVGKSYTIDVAVTATTTQYAQINLKDSNGGAIWNTQPISAVGTWTNTFTATTPETAFAVYPNNNATARSNSITVKAQVYDSRLKLNGFIKYIPTTT